MYEKMKAIAINLKQEKKMKNIFTLPKAIMLEYEEQFYCFLEILFVDNLLCQ